MHPTATDNKTSQSATHHKFLNGTSKLSEVIVTSPWEEDDAEMFPPTKKNALI